VYLAGAEWAALWRYGDINGGDTEAFAQYIIYLDSVPSLLECFYLCRFFKFILCSIILGALLYTSRVLELHSSALLINWIEITYKKKK